MNDLIDSAIIELNLKIINKPEYKQIAIVTLNFAGVFEIRYCRLCIRPFNNTLWFQPPALTAYQNAKCFVIPDKDLWRYLESKVFEQFYLDCKEWAANGQIPEDFVKNIKRPEYDYEAGLTDEDYKAIERM